MSFFLPELAASSVISSGVNTDMNNLSLNKMIKINGTFLRIYVL